MTVLILKAEVSIWKYGNTTIFIFVSYLQLWVSYWLP